MSEAGPELVPGSLVPFRGEMVGGAREQVKFWPPGEVGVAFSGALWGQIARKTGRNPRDTHPRGGQVLSSCILSRKHTSRLTERNPFGGAALGGELSPVEPSGSEESGFWESEGCQI